MHDRCKVTQHWACGGTCSTTTSPAGLTSGCRSLRRGCWSSWGRSNTEVRPDTEPSSYIAGELGSNCLGGDQPGWSQWNEMRPKARTQVSSSLLSVARLRNKCTCETHGCCLWHCDATVGEKFKYKQCWVKRGCVYESVATQPRDVSTRATRHHVKSTALVNSWCGTVSRDS